MRNGMDQLPKIESLLFVSGENGLTSDELATLLEIDRETLDYQLLRLKKRYENDQSSGLQLVTINHHYQLVTKPQFAEIIKQYAQSPFAQKLTQASLETLAIIAYQQPVTRLTIDDIRGVNSNGMIQKLEQRDLIKIVGKQESPGRPNLYGVTDYFYQYFGLNSLEEMPDLSTLLQKTNDEDQLFE